MEFFRDDAEKENENLIERTKHKATGCGKEGEAGRILFFISKDYWSRCYNKQTMKIVLKLIINVGILFGIIWRLAFRGDKIFYSRFNAM